MRAPRRDGGGRCVQLEPTRRTQLGLRSRSRHSKPHQASTAAATNVINSRAERTDKEHTISGIHHSVVHEVPGILHLYRNNIQARHLETRACNVESIKQNLNAVKVGGLGAKRIKKTCLKQRDGTSKHPGAAER